MECFFRIAFLAADSSPVELAEEVAGLRAEGTCGSLKITKGISAYVDFN